MQDRVNYRFWDTKERVMLDWDCICQTAFNCTREEGNEIQRYGLMYFVFTTPQRFIPLQCTGLKDKNGKLIFEGDIVKIHIQGDILVSYGIVFWNNQEAKFLRTSNLVNINNKQYGQSFWYNGSTEVIGNIYQNPELLEGQC